MVARDVVPQPDGGEGDEDEVDAVQEAPARLQQPEEEGGQQDGQQQVHGAHQRQVDQPHLIHTQIFSQRSTNIFRAINI